MAVLDNSMAEQALESGRKLILLPALHFNASRLNLTGVTVEVEVEFFAT